MACRMPRQQKGRTRHPDNTWIGLFGASLGTPLRTLVEVTCNSSLNPCVESRKEARCLDCVCRFHVAGALVAPVLGIVARQH